jgi:hypothetical protein
VAYKCSNAAVTATKARVPSLTGIGLREHEILIPHNIYIDEKFWHDMPPIGQELLRIGESGDLADAAEAIDHLAAQICRLASALHRVESNNFKELNSAMT